MFAPELADGTVRRVSGRLGTSADRSLGGVSDRPAGKRKGARFR